MPSADMRSVTTNNANGPLPLRGPEFTISAKDVEGLVSEIKENLRLSASTFKASVPPCRKHLCRRTSRASPYCVPTRTPLCSCEGPDSKSRRAKHKQDVSDDPYEYLQKLLRDGSLVNEAVRRVQLGLTPKQRYFYESDDEGASPLILCTQEN